MACNDESAAHSSTSASNSTPDVLFNEFYTEVLLYVCSASFSIGCIVFAYAVHAGLSSYPSHSKKRKT
jgi:hypothetical protein